MQPSATVPGWSTRSGAPRDVSHLRNAPASTSTRRMAVEYVIPSGVSRPQHLADRAFSSTSSGSTLRTPKRSQRASSMT